MNDTTPPLPDRETLLQLILDNCDLNVSAEEAAGKTLTQLGIDSLELIELALELEGSYQLTLDMDDLGAETTLSDLVDGLLKSAV
jgi:acyl carrier protein